jgi:Ca2+-binding RTX toxin-like protein
MVQNKFDASGKPAADGQFDGVIVAPMPWAYYGGNPVVAAPKAIGWTDSYDDPIVYETASNDILFFDKFSVDQKGSSLNGLAGNDWIIADQTDGDGVDVLTGGLGTDIFWLGYERYGAKRESYTNPEKSSRAPDSAYALISDFNSSEDYIRLPLAKTSYSFVAASALPEFISQTHGNGTGIFSNGDLVAYVSGLTALFLPI